MGLVKPSPLSKKLSYITLITLMLSAFYALMAQTVGTLTNSPEPETFVVIYTSIGFIYGAASSTADMCSIKYTRWTGNKF